CSLTSLAHADWPVFDASVLAQTVQQLDEMKKHYDMLKQQYDELMATKNAVTGSYGVSLLENGPLAELGRRAVPGTWQEVVSLQQSGALPGFFSQRQDYFQKLFPTVSEKLFSQDPNNRNIAGYKLSTDNTRAAFASTEAIYNKIQDRLKTIESLTKEIDKTANVKNATDLNSRIAAENGFLNVEMARLNSMQLSLQTVMQNNQNQSTANHAEFFGEEMK
ncbi:MAG: hypothetical protein JNK65_02230, partial [Deltaproteobacteria bacterium]|nr:hypothetical protein [Deltaproteobacteria bacterium]